MDSTGDPDVIMRLWGLLSEVSEQLSQNRSTAVNIHGLADGVKAQAIHSQTGFVLRRFNLDKPKDVYEAELERMNAAMSAENLTLLNDNRQLSTLIREYEQTLEKTMEKFRTHAHEVQQRELALMRQYESIIIERETEALKESLAVNNARSESLVRISRLLRAVLRKLGGEDIQAYEAYTQAQARAARIAQSREASSSAAASASSTAERSEAAEEEQDGARISRQDKGKQRDHGTQEEEPLPVLDVDRLLNEEEDPEKRVATAEWALSREIELARLQRENEELRALVNGLLPPNVGISRPGTTRTPTMAPGTGAAAPAAQQPVKDTAAETKPEQQVEHSKPSSDQQDTGGGDAVSS
ncbi:hypothetical protein OH77DRAFT_1408823 [Trametes cingulata]|nr:hypothetical protein OH77DRAFT_1408823 [Trametes cingulata]